jgi:hypothetical protein
MARIRSVFDPAQRRVRRSSSSPRTVRRTELELSRRGRRSSSSPRTVRRNSSSLRTVRRSRSRTSLLSQKLAQLTAVRNHSRFRVRDGCFPDPIFLCPTNSLDLGCFTSRLHKESPDHVPSEFVNSSIPRSISQSWHPLARFRNVSCLYSPVCEQTYRLKLPQNSCRSC